jgi:hypothetical protein
VLLGHGNTLRHEPTLLLVIGAVTAASSAARSRRSTPAGQTAAAPVAEGTDDDPADGTDADLFQNYLHGFDVAMPSSHRLRASTPPTAGANAAVPADLMRSQGCGRRPPGSGWRRP